MADLRIITIVGARPQFIKAAAVSAAIARKPGLTEQLIHTGQHFDDGMSGTFFAELGLPEPACNLGISGGSHGAMTARMLEGIEPILSRERPDAVLVYGDTNSTLAGALAAAKLLIPVIHVEAGLRSFRRTQPEEINRRLVDHIADLLFCPTGTAVANLAREGIERNVFNVGDVMYDMVLRLAASDRGRDITRRLGLTPRAYQVATLHRAENTDEPERLRDVLTFLKIEANSLPVVMPLHPRTREICARFGFDFSGLTVVDPLGYADMAHLIRGATRVLTDSGGLQKEAYFHRVPCVTLRDETEWTETIAAGWNRLWRGPGYATPRRDIPDYGDGHAAEKIVAAISAQLHPRSKAAV